MTIEEFKSNVIKWAIDKRIIPNSNFDAQYIKLIEELGELALGIRKQDEKVIKDSVGDVAVVLVILAGLKKMSEQVFVGNNEDNDFMDNFQELCGSIGMLPRYTEPYNENRESMKYVISYCLTLLKKVAEKQGYDFMECCELAWNEIKDRKGYLREDGIFVKEEDIKNKGEN